MNIIIYTTPEKLLHKQDRLENDPDKSDCGIYSWRLYRPFKNHENTDYIFFATKGFIRGFFVIDDIDEKNVEWRASSWQDIIPIPCKPFQNFKYMKRTFTEANEKCICGHDASEHIDNETYTDCMHQIDLNNICDCMKFKKVGK